LFALEGGRYIERWSPLGFPYAGPGSDRADRVALSGDECAPGHSVRELSVEREHEHPGEIEVGEGAVHVVRSGRLQAGSPSQLTFPTPVG
jgi:hypothetical protein